MRKILFLLALCMVQGVFAQTDSVTFVDAPWEVRQIEDGLTFRQYHFKHNLFKSSQHISILEVDPGLVEISVVADTVLKKTSDFFEGFGDSGDSCDSGGFGVSGNSESYGALAAVNGSFFDLQSKGLLYNSVVHIRVDGEDLAFNEKRKDGRGFFQQGAVATLQGGLFILESDGTYNWENYLYAEDIMTTGPMLKKDGVLYTLPKSAFNSKRHPRTVVAKVSSDLVYFIVVDGRSPKAAGMTLPEVQLMVNWLGAKDVINLDGGGSSTMCLRGADNEDSVINRPSDNKKFDHKGQRRVANAIVFSL